MTLSPRAAALPVVFVCLLAQMSFAKEGSKIAGTWKLVSYVVEVQVTGQRLPVMGEKPTGYVSFSPEGRVFLILTGEARKPAKTDQERADLLDGLVAYTGAYRVEGGTWTTSVDVAWNPEWVGTKQVRSFKLEGNRLDVLSPWRLMPNWADRGMTRSIITFERSE
jgi:Lipocalin-like domain